MITTRGFTGRGRAKADQRRVPPGQYVTEDFPVLSAGPTPHTPLDRWTLALQDGGSLVGKWTWEEFQALPQTELTVDIHCVTKWSKLGTVWVTCAGCARMVPMAELRLYAIELGAILRCPSCDEAVVRIGRTPRGLRLDLRAATVVAVSDGDVQ
jgi:DMSO/TMAO reductase YedYZ molybdopterin-dependent catalytic subunit